MGLAPRKTEMTTQAFIAWQDQPPDKHEFLAGEVFAMGGARRLHLTIAASGFALLDNRLRGGPNRAFLADMKPRVSAAASVFHPDLLVTCHPEDLRAETVMHQPEASVEVLFESTAARDRGDKFAAYRKLDGLEEYGLIDPDRRDIEVYRRMPNGDWLLAASGAGRGLILNSLDFAAPPEALFEAAETDAVEL